MRKIILLIFLLLAAAIFLATFRQAYLRKTEEVLEIPKAARISRVGEKMVYEVRMGNIALGRAVFAHLPNAVLDGREVNLMSFETKLTFFSDLEMIYSDPDTFLPLKVVRSISTWPNPEKITESYDQQNFVLTIKKLKGNKKEDMVIKKKGVINNAILLPYYVRDTAGLDIGYTLKANLPTQEFVIELKAKEEVDTPAGKFMAYRFESTPRKFQIWISADGRKIPVIIKGSSGLGYTLVIREYSQ